MNRFSLISYFLVLALYGVETVSAQSAVPVSKSAGEKLIPAAMGVRRDQKGSSWNLDTNGALSRIGTSMINSGLMLSINGEKFLCQQPLMTADGNEFVMRGGENRALPGLQITRRIGIMEEDGGLQYLEIFTNSSANSLVLNIGLNTNFSGNYKTFITDKGRAEAIVLGKNEEGILVTPGATQSNKAFLFSLCDEGSANKPTISAQNRYSLTFQYRFSIAPGKTLVLAHAVAQVVIPPQFDRRNLMKAFRPFQVSRIVSRMPKKLRPFLINGQDTKAWSELQLMADTSLGALHVKRGPHDILAMGDKTRLVGTAECSELRLTTAYGEILVPFEKVAAIVGRNRGLHDRVRVFLTDGQVLSGKAEVGDFSFALANGGRMKLDLNSLDRLVRAKQKGGAVWDDSTAALIETYDGDRLKVSKTDDITLTGVTPWGELVFSIDDLIWMGPRRDEPIGHFAELKDGNSCLIFPSGKPLVLHSEILGEHQLELRRIRSIITSAAADRSKYGGISGLATFIQLAGNQQVVGKLEDSHIKLISNGSDIVLAPGDIRKLVRGKRSQNTNSRTKPNFRIEMWDGGLIEGFFQSESLSVKVGTRNWLIPLADIEELSTPTPDLGEEALKKIRQLLTQLGSDAWKDREKATIELGAFGYLASPVLQQEAGKSSDPEVRRRIEQILSRTEH